jgi:hypothetical protein
MTLNLPQDLGSRSRSVIRRGSDFQLALVTAATVLHSHRLPNPIKATARSLAAQGVQAAGLSSAAYGRLWVAPWPAAVAGSS